MHSQHSTSWNNNIYRSDILPPTTVKKSVKESDKWQRAMLNAFEHIGVTQFNENIEFMDYYRMVEGDLAYQELAEVVPQMENIQDLLDGVGIPAFMKHYDIIGILINSIVGKYIDYQDKFHITDTGEVADNEFLRFKTDEINSHLKNVLENHIQRKLAERGIDPKGQQFQSQEEQQQFIQQLEQIRKEITPKDLEDSTKTKFKSKGRIWAEATLEKDKEHFNLQNNFEKQELKDKLLTGRYFRHYRLRYDSYEPERWDPRNTFISKELDSKYPQKGEYIGRLHFMTPGEVIRIYGHHLDSKQQKDIIGGNPTWQNFVGDGMFSGSINEAIEKNFVKPQRVPFSNFYDYNFNLGLQDDLGIPMGEYTSLEKGSNGETRDRFLPRIMGDNHGRYNYYANVLRSDFEHRRDLCQVTEVYFRAYDLYGYLTYENEFGRVVTELVSEDILPEFLKENDIKQTYKESLVDIVEEFEVNTLKWFYKPVVYEGVKIQANLAEKPIYLYCKPCDHQIKGDSEFDVHLPVGGYIGKSLAKRIAPYQSAYNLCMNQIFNLLEKEIGMFFLMDINLLPSEFEGYGDAKESLMHLRNIAKDAGIFPVQTSGDTQKNQNHFQSFGVHSITYMQEINTRVQLAEFYQRKAFETIGINPQMSMEPTKYETATGVRQSTEASFAQLSDILSDFGDGNRNTLELHLSVAQYAQSNKKDISLMYTKSDASIEYLKLQDPEFPLRRLGLIPSADSKKRKELEEFKMYLMNTNTLGADTLEIAKLIGSDAMSELIEVAAKSREEREAQEAEKHQRQLQLQEQQAEAERIREAEEWERNEVSKERDRQARKEIELIDATGRAASKDANEASFDEIEQRRDEFLQKETNANRQAEKDLREFKHKERTTDKEFALKMEKLKLQAKQLEQRQKETKAKVEVAYANKN